MEGDFLSDSFNIEEEGRGEADHSFAVNGVIGIPGIDCFLQLSCGEGMFPDKSPIEARDACATVNNSTGIDSFQVVQWFNQLDRDLYRWGSFYMNHGTLCTTENSC